MGVTARRTWVCVTGIHQQRAHQTEIVAGYRTKRQLTVRVRFAGFLAESAAVALRGVVAFLAPFLACGVPLAVAVAPAVVLTSPPSSVAACFPAVVVVYEPWAGVEGSGV